MPLFGPVSLLACVLGEAKLVGVDYFSALKPSMHKFRKCFSSLSGDDMSAVRRDKFDSAYNFILNSVTLVYVIKPSTSESFVRKMMLE